MKKILLNIFTLIIAVNTISAQSFKVESSELWEENLGIPVLVTDDGQTVFQYDDPKLKKMFISVFDKNHKLIVKKKEVKFQLNYLDHFTVKHSSNVHLWLSVNNKARIYMECNQTQYKVTLSQLTWEIEKEEKISNVFRKVHSDTEPHTLFDKRAIDFQTGNRAIVTVKYKKLTKEDFESQKVDFNDIVDATVNVYNPEEQVIHEFKFDFINHKYQGMQVQDMWFNNNIVYFVSELYPIADKRMYDITNYYSAFMEMPFVPGGVLCISAYNLKTRSLISKELYELKKGYKFAGSLFYTNTDNSSLTIEFLQRQPFNPSRVSYDIIFQPLNAATLELDRPYYLPSQKLDEFVMQKCNMKEGYQGGFLSKLIVDKSGNIFATKVKNVTTASKITDGYIYTKNQELIGVSYFDNKGKEIYGAAYPYNTNGTAQPLSMVQYIASEVSKNDFNYVLCRASTKNYIFLDNLSKNYNLPLDVKPQFAKSLDDCNAMAIEFNAAGEMKQYYVFGESSGENKYSDFANGLYDEKNNTLIVKTYDGAGYKNTRATWIKLD